MQIYADNAATTKMSQTAIDAMMPYMQGIFGNPSSLHSVGQEAAEALSEARAAVAASLGCEPKEIYFTSGGSEADNQAIVSAAANGAKKGKKHIISTAFEHHAVLHTLKKLEKQGFEVTLLDVHQSGLITADEVAAAIIKGYEAWQCDKSYSAAFICTERLNFHDDEIEEDELSSLSASLEAGEKIPEVTVFERDGEFFVVDGNSSAVAYALAFGAHVPARLVCEPSDTRKYVKMKNSL